MLATNLQKPRRNEIALGYPVRLGLAKELSLNGSASAPAENAPPRNAPTVHGQAPNGHIGELPANGLPR